MKSGFATLGPGSANGFANTALIWNYRDNTWSTRDLPLT